jgi:teichuronic acid biosynthesis glycosyltransferase TuaC
MSEDTVPVDTYLVAAVSPRLDVPSGITSYLLSLVRHLRGTEFRPAVLGLSDESRESPAGLPGVWHGVARTAGSAGLRYWRGLYNYVDGHRQELASGVVHAQRPDYLRAFHRHAAFRSRTVCTLHGPHLLNVRRVWGAAGAWLFERIQRAGLRDVGAVIAVSRETEDLFLDLYPWLRGRTCTIHVGVDTELFQPRDQREAREQLRLPAGKPLILFVGRLHPQKGIRLLLRAFELVRRRHPDAELYVIGDGPEEGASRQLAHRLDLGDSCTFLGKQTRATVAAYMNAADALVLSSVWEGMPTVVLEALASGLACVTTRVGDVPEAVTDGASGYIVESDPEALAEGVEKVLSRGREEWMEPCVRAARPFDWSAIVERTVQVYRRVAGERATC